MDALTTVIVALNAIANALGYLLFPVAFLPGWLSATLIAIATGIAMLVMFKYTSNQRAIKRVRRGIRANLLAVKLFKDNPWLGFKSQGRVLLGALNLLLLAVVPILAMTVPMVLLLTQMSLWYQAAPLPLGAETVVTVKLKDDPASEMSAVELAANDAVEDLSGPVRITSQNEVCWSLRTRQPGYHELQFTIDGQRFVKELAVGEGFMRVSTSRPARDWLEVLENPRESPFDRDSLVQSIEIEYPERDSWISGTDWWIVYWFVVAFVAAFILRGAFKVNI